MILDFDEITRQVTAAQEEAAQIHRNPFHFGIEQEVILKDGGDYTDVVDIAVQDLLKKRLSPIIIDAAFLGEEDLDTNGRRYRWIVDPTDGTAVFEIGGDYFSSSIALEDRETSKIVFGSVYQSMTNRQFVRTPTKLEVREFGMPAREPRKTNSRGFGEYLGCSFGTSKYYKEFVGIKERLEKVFTPTHVPELDRSYAAKDAKPASGSSALFCCDIADANRHFALLFFQKAWDLAAGGMYASQAKCPIVIFDNHGNVLNKTLEQAIVGCTKDTLINVGVFANEHAKEYILNKFNS